MPSQDVIKIQCFKLISISFKASKLGSSVFDLHCILNGIHTEEMCTKLVVNSDSRKVGGSHECLRNPLVIFISDNRLGFFILYRLSHPLSEQVQLENNDEETLASPVVLTTSQEVITKRVGSLLYIDEHLRL